MNTFWGPHVGKGPWLGDTQVKNLEHVRGVRDPVWTDRQTQLKMLPSRNSSKGLYRKTTEKCTLQVSFNLSVKFCYGAH